MFKTFFCNKAVSHSYQLDIERRTRSFQNKRMSYGTLLDRIAKAYPGMEVMDGVSEGASLEKFTLQYEETD
ncbi:hypothetical protein ACE3MS_27050 [Paenibacillus dendritiformis]|uniref:hypothetical protein n=1 Tax=Paenibacillus dendritiformis TaxID=130049 RepID=UPI003666EB2D